MEEQIAASKIRQFLEGLFPLVKGVNNESSLVGGGLLDSLGILDVVAFIEREFDISIDDEELSPENFQTVRSIAKFVVRKCDFK